MVFVRIDVRVDGVTLVLSHTCPIEKPPRRAATNTCSTWPPV
jgi:hypothetical protein